MPLLDSGDTITAVFILNEELSAFTEARQTAFREGLATTLGVNASAISLNITHDGLIVTATIRPTGMFNSDAAVGILTNTSFADLSAGMGVTIESLEAGLDNAVENVPSLVTPQASALSSESTAVSTTPLIILGGCVLIGVALAYYLLRSRRKKPAKESRLEKNDKAELNVGETDLALGEQFAVTSPDALAQHDGSEWSPGVQDVEVRQGVEFTPSHIVACTPRLPLAGGSTPALPPPLTHTPSFPALPEELRSRPNSAAPRLLSPPMLPGMVSPRALDESTPLPKFPALPRSSSPEEAPASESSSPPSALPADGVDLSLISDEELLALVSRYGGDENAELSVLASGLTPGKCIKDSSQSDANETAQQDGRHVPRRSSVDDLLQAADRLKTKNKMRTRAKYDSAYDSEPSDLSSHEAEEWET